MKKIILGVTGTLLLAAGISIMVASCDKEEIEKTNPEQLSATPATSSVDFSAYYQETEVLATEFWSACDKAYQKHQQEFLSACQRNDFAEFQRLTNLDAAYFEHFKAVLLKAQAEIEADHPGITAQYRESPCSECAAGALSRVGAVMDTLQGHSVDATVKLNNTDCWFVCSLSCIASMELYAPCVLACVRVCKKYMQNW
ncbi:MAG: hypothetical protein IKZ52_08165 [Bacteroidales bacterium]|nr:hypothetical protein [Bacteroidales bacterium]